MSNFNNFSYKLFGILITLFCCSGFNCAFARSFLVCEEGYYLSSCGQVTVGTNWLKGIPNKTPDYYSYGSYASDPINMINLRKFFTGLEPVSYKTKNSDQSETVWPSEYSEHRNTILTTFCDNLANIECKKCPNSAKVPKSTVEKISPPNLPFVTYTWVVHTIADCYMDEFSDNTGKYIYVPNVAVANSHTGTKCYYSNNVQGDELVIDSTTSE